MDKRDYSIFSQGKLKRKDDSLLFEKYDGEKHTIPIMSVDNLYVFSEMDFNTKLINFLSKSGVLVHFFNYYGFYTGTFYPKETLNSGMLFVEQTKHYIKKQKRIFIAREFLRAAAKNILRNLKYYENRKGGLQNHIEQIENLSKQLDFQGDIPALMGIEGNIRKTYYETFNLIINQDIDFEKRVKNPPDNMINSLISYLNTFLYTTILGEIYKTQLTPLISFLHEPGVRRYSLSLDIAEIFKPLIVDRMIFSLLNKNQITEKHFEQNLEFTYFEREW